MYGRDTRGGRHRRGPPLAIPIRHFVVGFLVGRPSTVSAVAAVNVLLIAGSLWIAMGPTGTSTAEPAH